MSQIIYVTQSGYEELKKKLEQLRIEQKENIIALQEARSQGDLSENADYDAARNNQARIAAELEEVEQSLKKAVVITGEEGNNLGKFVDVNFIEEGVVETYRLVGTTEADPLEQKISNESPLGNAIINAKEGDKVLVKTEDGEQFEVIVERIFLPEPEKKKGKKTK